VCVSVGVHGVFVCMSACVCVCACVCLSVSSSKSRLYKQESEIKENHEKNGRLVHTKLCEYLSSGALLSM
jgi:hypothetical protein